jgi:hypothetical protein
VPREHTSKALAATRAMTGTPYYLLVFRVVGAVDFKVSVGMGSWRGSAPSRSDRPLSRAVAG